MITEISGMVTAIATASATIIALISFYLIRKEDKREKDLLIENFKEQLDIFAEWYKNFARISLNELYDYPRAGVRSKRVYEEIMQKIPACNADLNYWKENHMQIRQAMKKKKYDKKRIEDIQKFMAQLIEFMRLYECVSDKLEKSKGSIGDFKDNFYKDISSVIVADYGKNFNACLAQMLKGIQENYKSLASQLELKCLDISGV